MEIQSYRDLKVWRKATDFAVDVYALTKQFPKEELYGLTAQLRRAAVSVPSNIAEGRAKRSTRDFIRFLSIPYGSLAEIGTQLIIVHRLGYFDQRTLDIFLDRSSEIARMINGMVNSLERKTLNAEC